MQVPGRKRIILILVEKVEWNDQLCQMRSLNHKASSRLRGPDQLHGLYHYYTASTGAASSFGIVSLAVQADCLSGGRWLMSQRLMN